MAILDFNVAIVCNLNTMYEAFKHENALIFSEVFMLICW